MQNMENKQSADPPTTYVQVDPHSFRRLVQRLTGAVPESKSSAAGPRLQAFKALRDRRCSAVRGLEVKLRRPTSSSKSPEPVTLNASPVTPLASNILLSPREDEDEEEERAIKEKGYYLRPSPRGGGPPQLLTLFPLSSPELKQRGEVGSSRVDCCRGICGNAQSN